MAVLALTLFGACSDDSGSGGDLVEQFKGAEPCPSVGDTIPDPFDGCREGDTLMAVQYFDCTDGRQLIYLDGIGHGFTGGEMQAGQWPQEAVDECTD